MVDQKMFISTAQRGKRDDFFGKYMSLYSDFATGGFLNSSTQGKPIPQVKNIIFNDPATIVYWQDGTKTVVKTMHGDTFNEEYGVAMAYMKKIFGSSTGFKKLVVKYKPVSKK